MRGVVGWAANEALELGHGGIKVVAQATGLGERTIRRGCEEMRQVRPTAGHDKRRIGQPCKAVASHYRLLTRIWSWH